MSAAPVMNGALMSYEGAMTVARGAATGMGKPMWVIRDTSVGKAPVAFHPTDRKPENHRYAIVTAFDATGQPINGKTPWYMGDKAPEPPMPATSKAATLVSEAEATVKAVHDIRDMVETLVEELAAIRERQSLVDVSAMIDSLEASMDDAYEATYGALPDSDE